MTPPTLRRAVESDFAAIWPIFQTVVATGATYVFAADTPEEEAFAYWFGPGVRSWVAEADGRIVGMYKIVANQRDRGAHVANASFMVAPDAAGRGIGRAMGEDSLRRARALGFRAMQFNFVVSTNQPAVDLWRSLGFAIAGTLPGAFHHDSLGYVDAYVMFRSLDGIEPAAD
jgi:L-amino acid N-acyltransferase YncA